MARKAQLCIWAAVVLFLALSSKSQEGDSISGISSKQAEIDAPVQQISNNTNLVVDFTKFGPYKGAVLKEVDTSTLFGKVMCGYQGWFGVPGDGSPDNNWRHWTKTRGPMEDGNAKVDLWPDVSELSQDERFPTNFKLANGQPAEIFSSYERATVLRHFHWMQEYGIDGVFVQRFAIGLQNNRNLERDNTVLAHCREGANLYGRTYAVMYDLTGLPAGHIQDVMNDWRELRRQMSITDDPAYLHHRGKPLVAIWGIGFNDHRGYTLQECRKLIDFFKNDPESGSCTVMVGVPAYWRELDHDAINDPNLLDVLKTADVISPWTVGRYTNSEGAAVYEKETLKSDLAWCEQHQIDFMPVIFPGFSWYNMYGREFNMAPRSHGQFLWSQFLGIKQAGANMAYIAMFDELDEGTAIFKCVNDVPTGEKSKFLNFEGLPSDYYLKIAGEGKKLIQNEMRVPVQEVTTLIPANPNNVLVLNTNNIDPNRL